MKEIFYSLYTIFYNHNRHRSYTFIGRRIQKSK